MTTPRTLSEIVNRRYDFVFLFDVTDGNPNGDPDAGNLPRLDPQTLQGFVTDVCIKRKLRNAIAAFGQDKPGSNIYFQTQDAVYEDRILNLQHQKAHDAITPKDKSSAAEAESPKAKADVTSKARAWMCEHFYDIRAFGAVMTTGVNCGQVRGPVQLTFARSIDPIVPMEISITRKSVTTVEEAQKQAKSDGSVTGTMGRKNTVPYALYRGFGFVNPLQAADTKFTYADFRLLLEAFVQMFELDRSAARGLMTMRKIVLFEHDSRLGCAPAHLLFDRVQVAPLGVDKAPRQFADYAAAMSIDRQNLPRGVNVYELPEEFGKLFPNP
jgi:CRISPR-associated protein Csd2